MRKLLFLLSTLSLLVACGKNATANDIDDTSLAKVYLAGEMKIGISVPFPPLAFAEGGEYKGYDIDILNEVCTILEIDAKFIEIDWDKKDELLASGEIDALASGFSKTPERESEYGMTVPIIQNVQCIVVRKGDDRFLDFESLKTYSVGCQIGSSAESYVQNKILNGFEIRIQSYPDVSTALAGLKNNLVDAVIADLVVVNYTLQKNRLSSLKILPTALQNEQYVYAFRKEDKALIHEVNRTLAQMAEDGVLGQITKKWFTNDISLIR